MPPGANYLCSNRQFQPCFSCMARLSWRSLERGGYGGLVMRREVKLLSTLKKGEVDIPIKVI